MANGGFAHTWLFQNFQAAVDDTPFLASQDAVLAESQCYLQQCLQECSLQHCLQSCFSQYCPTHNAAPLLLLGTAGGPPVEPVAMTPQELAKRCGLVFQFPERYFLGGTLQDVSTWSGSGSLLHAALSACACMLI